MIVTCPNCSAKYRVRDDAVPAEGAQLECPECAQMFLAHRPRTHDNELVDAVERLTRWKEEAEETIKDLEKQLEISRAEFERAKSEFDRSNEQAGRALAQRDHERNDMRAELEKLRAETQQLRTQTQQQTEHARGLSAQLAAKDQQLGPMAQQAQQANQTIGELNQQIGQLKARAQQLDAQLELARSAPPPLAASGGGGSAKLRDELAKAQTVAGRLTSELDSARRTIDQQNEELGRLRLSGGGAPAPNPQLEAELTRLKTELEIARRGGGGAGPEVMGLVSAVSPMLWGLEQAITYLEPFAAQQPELGGHVRQLQLLKGVLERLAQAVENS
jgi:predicted Zn finger-like uncharacterized protein